MQEVESNYWGSSDMVFQCLIDKKRVLAFKNAILNTVKKGDIVADLGTGTGIMSAFAVDAGAERVYAVEADRSVYETFNRNLKTNGFKDKIKLFEGDATKIILPEKVDVVICEMVATGLIDELQIPVMNNILKSCNPKARIILSKMQNFVELVNADDNFYGHKLQVIQYEYSWDKKKRIQPLTKKFMYSEIDFSKKNSGLISVTIPFKIKKTGKINAIRLTNETIFWDDSTLDETDAYCMPLCIPFDPIKVKKDETVNLNLSYQMCKGMDNLKFYIKKMKS